MRAAFTILSLAVIICACQTRKKEVRIPPGAPAVLFGDCRRENDPGFSGQEQTLIGAARRYLERSEHREIDAYYRVRHTFDGNEIIVMYVSNYHGAEPVFGKYCTVLMGENGSLMQVF